METWLVIALVLIVTALLAGGGMIFIVRTVEKRVGKEIGILYINPEETDPGEGVYAQFYKSADPKSFEDGMAVVLQVKVLRK